MHGKEAFHLDSGNIDITYMWLLAQYDLHNYLSENNNWAIDSIETFAITHLLQPMPGQSSTWSVSHQSFYVNKTGSKMTTLSTHSPHNPFCREFHKPSVQEEEMLGKGSLIHLLLQSTRSRHNQGQFKKYLGSLFPLLFQFTLEGFTWCLNQ